jgi:hypothetical protein
MLLADPQEPKRKRSARGCVGNIAAVLRRAGANESAATNGAGREWERRSGGHRRSRGSDGSSRRPLLGLARALARPQAPPGGTRAAHGYVGQTSAQFASRGDREGILGSDDPATDAAEFVGRPRQHLSTGQGDRDGVKRPSQRLWDERLAHQPGDPTKRQLSACHMMRREIGRIDGQLRQTNTFFNPLLRSARSVQR